MKISLRLPIDVDNRSEFQNGAAVREIAQAAEAAGADAAFITDHPAPMADWRASGGHDALDPFAGLAFVAAATTRLRLHTNLVVLPYRNPFVTAKAAATLDVLSDGRLIMGCGVGYMEGEYRALGVPFAERGALMDEALRTMKAAWGEGEVRVTGRHFDAQGVLPRPRPVQQPHPPIWAGGNSDRAVRRAAELCNGWSPMFASPELGRRARTDAIASPEDLARKLDLLRELLGAQGRSGPFDVCIGPQKHLRHCTRQEADDLVEHLAQLAALGVNWTYCGVPAPSRAAFLDNLRWFGEEIAPRIHALEAAALIPA